MRFACLLIVAAIFASAPAQAQAPRFQQGQVWEYRERPIDEGSLLKIQQIERDPALGLIYHISIVGVRMSNPQMASTLPHAPVSQGVLDASVTKLASGAVAFPPADEGIAEWKRARGGVFTIPVNEIVDVVDQATKEVGR